MTTYIIVAILIIVGLIRTYREGQQKKKVIESQKSRNNVGLSQPLVTPISLFSKKHIVSELQPESRQVVNNTSTNTSINYPSLENSYTDIRSNQQYSGDIKPNSMIEDCTEENLAFSLENKVNSLDLSLDTKEDLKKAFIHSIIFERKY